MFSKTHSALVKKLLAARKVTAVNCVQETRCTKFVRAFCKQLKKDDMLVNLLHAIVEESEFTACITISKHNWDALVDKIDTSFVLGQLENLPHVWVCRHWRWPDVWSSLQLLARPICVCGRERNTLKICIQPYHYDKIQEPCIAPVLVPRCPEPVPAREVPMLNECLMFNDADKKNHEILTPLRDISDAQVVEYSNPTHWCSVSYYELNQRVGETFNAINPSMRVDGFTDPCGTDRFCLGLLSNVNRNQATEVTRRNIGNGVRMSYFLGEVFVECLSENAIFVQSISCNYKFGWHPASVVKIPPGSTLKVFSNQDFAMLLAQTVNCGFVSVYRLTEMCTIRLSFVKGWGAAYRRQTVTATPCWIEVRLNGPLQWLDKVLTKMGSPNIKCSSMS